MVVSAFCFPLSVLFNTMTPSVPYAQHHRAPLLGHLAAFQQNRLALYHDTAREGGMVRLRMGVVDVYHVSDPAYIQHILQDNQRNYGRHPYGQRLLRLLTGNGILTLDGEAWLKQRRLAQPAFHRQRLAAFGETMVSAALGLAAEWQQAKGATLNIAQSFSRLTLQIAGKTLFSTDISDPTNRIGQTATYGVEFARDRLVTLFPALLAVPTGLNRRYRAARRAADALIYTLIQQRRAQTDKGDDLLGLLMQAVDEETGESLGDEELHDQMMTMLFAGQETTANALAWIFCLLAQHPESAATALAEISSVLGERLPTMEDLPNLPYIRMVIDEAMRLYPPVWLLGRRALQADRLGGYTIPKGALIAISPYAVHRHLAYWNEPTRFDPLRFTLEAQATRPRFAYLPFGGGARQCMGNRFALMEAHLVLATLLPRVKVRVSEGYRGEPEPLLNLRPKGGMLMTVEERIGKI